MDRTRKNHRMKNKGAVKAKRFGDSIGARYTSSSLINIVDLEEETRGLYTDVRGTLNVTL